MSKKGHSCKKILVVTPRAPFTKRGACEQDRAAGIEHLIRLGYNVRVVTKALPTDLPSVEEARDTLEIPIETVPYKASNLRGMMKLLHYAKRLLWPPHWDGAAFEYTDPEIQTVVKNQVAEFKPDIIWFEYTYLWPLYHLAKKAGIPTITRSINYEPQHFLDENGRGLLNYIRFVPKYFSERKTLALTQAVLAITPKEEQIYAGIVPDVYLDTLPLRALPEILKSKHEVRDTDMLHVFFWGSTYTVSHNRRAMDFVVREIGSEIAARGLLEKIHINILGSKLPEEYRANAPENITFHGYVEDLEEFLQGMDAALVPSLYGAGMQQKVFEPLARGIPTITSGRVLANYPFTPDRDVLVGESAADFVDKLESLLDRDERERLAENAHSVSEEIFSRTHIDAIIIGAIEAVCKKS